MAALRGTDTPACHALPAAYIGEARRIGYRASGMRFALDDNESNTMGNWERSGADERYNELSDSDGLWGPFVCFRPERNQPFTRLRAFSLFAGFCSVYGMLLNFAIALGSNGQHLPKVYVVPVTLTLITFAAFELTLGPAWNRRAFLLARRDHYLSQTRRQLD